MYVLNSFFTGGVPNGNADITGMFALTTLNLLNIQLLTYRNSVP